MKKSISDKQSGQAIMELLVLIIAFMLCFLGLLTVMGLSIADIEIFADAKFNSEKEALVSDSGNDGHEIHTWRYTRYGNKNMQIPFLPADRPIALSGDLSNFGAAFNDPAYSNHGTDYEFNHFSTIQTENLNFGYETPQEAYIAANLIKGQSRSNESNNVLFNDKRYFQRRKIYDAVQKIIGVSIEKTDLENTHSNTVYFPAMKIFSSFSE